MLEFINQAQKRGLEVHLLSKDIEKAFDKVHHPSLIYKIFNKFKLPLLFCKTLANFLVDRTIKIKVNDVYSRMFSPKAGVPQGSTLGPLLYLMFINDAPQSSKQTILIEDKNNSSNNLQGTPSESFKGYKSEINIYFADDNVIMTTGCGDSDSQFGNKPFRTLVQKVTDWEEAHRIKTNANKSAIMHFSKKIRPRSNKLTLHPINNQQKQLKINKNDYIKFKSSHKILGIIFDSNLSFAQHLVNLKNSITADISSLRLLKDTNFATKTYLVKTIIQPKLLYAYPIYSYLSVPQKIIFQKCQNKAIYNFALSHMPYQQYPNAEQMHVMMKLKCIAQLAWDRNKKFHQNLKEQLPEFYNLFCKYTQIHPNKSKNTIIRPSPLQFALGPRPEFIYSEKYRH